MRPKYAVLIRGTPALKAQAEAGQKRAMSVTSVILHVPSRRGSCSPWLYPSRQAGSCMSQATFHGAKKDLMSSSSSPPWWPESSSRFFRAAGADLQ